ncbi:glutamine synthetase III family protein [Haloplasma contractile]|uniref:Glutamine synthetase type III protein n=1 Tax=Haloplasma contractile SSD-17B TaxID=1033810 RepID=F7PWP4_9MOLU|nr:glutamine synthetase III [Haloplasma contractile]ERJ12581.1 Glutamine synthetase type III protein [Haloplasma contractile SSD-17B]
MLKITDVFGSNVFNEKVMRERLPKDIFYKLQRTVKEGEKLEKDVANVVANAMKDWAVEKGATHFTHWFQPMTGKTAEKHDAFLNFTKEGDAIEDLSGKNLIMGEPDASSFPNGGLRSTFEARGYTTWDATSPAFLKETDGVLTLCIPTAFCSYIGDALDTKTPLLRSMEALDLATRRVLRLFGHYPKRTYPVVGAEQEYFLIDKRLYQDRKDLIYTGRTLFGAQAPKGQELDDHYFGSIKQKITSFMKDIDIELWKLGISAKTKHNEVAPAQHEFASIFTITNIATDQNQLLMETLEKVANRYDLVCLLHEKPFAEVNGSGKHNNWSIATSEGFNLFEPGDNPHSNTQFLVFLSAVIKAVDQYPELLRMSSSVYSNDFRLGGHEAPPAIISIFLGEQLEDILRQIEQGELSHSKTAERLDTGVITLPLLKKDVTDRNRTSPFAFTGNKFEFRMVGSSQTIADANIVLNSITADVLNQFADTLEQSENLSQSIIELVSQTIKDHRRVIFNGDGYSDEWVEEAEKRGLPNITSTVDAIPHMISKKSIDVFSRTNVFSEEELRSRYEIKLEAYSKVANIEARTMVHMVRKEIIPSVINYTRTLAESILKVEQVLEYDATHTQKSLLSDISLLIEETHHTLNQLESSLERAQKENGILEKAKLYRNEVLNDMKRLREPSDKLELLVGKDYWPFPTYGDLLFRI